MKTFIIASISADGFITPSSSNLAGPSTSWTSREDTDFFKQKTLDAGVIIMGRKTYDTIPEKFRPLKNRLNIIYTTHPNKVTNSLPLDNHEIQNTKYKIHPLTTGMDPNEIIAFLAENNFESVAITGGTSIYTQFLQAGVVDEIFLTIEPVLFGTGTPLFDKSIEIKLHLLETIDLSGQTKVLHYQVSKSTPQS